MSDETDTQKQEGTGGGDTNGKKAFGEYETVRWDAWGEVPAERKSLKTTTSLYSGRGSTIGVRDWNDGRKRGKTGRKSSNRRGGRRKNEEGQKRDWRPKGRQARGCSPLSESGIKEESKCLMLDQLGKRVDNSSWKSTRENEPWVRNG